jgi:hypothetical protein
MHRLSNDARTVPCWAYWKIVRTPNVGAVDVMYRHESPEEDRRSATDMEASVFVQRPTPGLQLEHSAPPVKLTFVRCRTGRKLCQGLGLWKAENLIQVSSAKHRGRPATRPGYPWRGSDSSAV